jgi:hypothetical protein
MIQNLICVMTRIPTEMTGNQQSCLQAKKLIAYHFACLLSFKTQGIASIARLQREEMPRSAKEHGGTGTFSTGIYSRLPSSLEFAMFVNPCKSQGAHKSTGSTASFKTHGKSNQIQIKSIAIVLLLITSHSPLSQWQVKSAPMVFSLELPVSSPLSPSFSLSLML